MCKGVEISTTYSVQVCSTCQNYKYVYHLKNVPNKYTYIWLKHFYTASLMEKEGGPFRKVGNNKNIHNSSLTKS